MKTARGIVTRHRWVGLAVLLLAMVASTTITSCGGSGGGGSDGGLCDQCGDDPDGPCLGPVEVDREPGAPRPCDVPGNTACLVDLVCLRGLGSGQRRCYPLEPDGSGAQLEFECKGRRPNTSTPGPATVTPNPTLTPSAQPTTNGPTPSPTFTPLG